MRLSAFSALIAILALGWGSVMAAPPKVLFGQDGALKIVQFTDTHYKTGKKASQTSTKCIAAVLDTEKPDIAIITGDLLYSNGGIEAIDSVMAPIIAREVPFVFVFGNHDTQFDLSHAEFYDHISSLPGSLMPPRGDRESPDYVVTVGSSVDSSAVKAAMYFLDSHAGNKIENSGKYAWLRHDQIQWYKAMSDSLERVPALMFFHIPLPEVAYADAAEKVQLVGTMGEKVCAPEINSGMFSAIKEQGDVKGVFFGHDHDNDFATVYYDVLLAYGRYTGGKTVYNHLGTPGARVIVFRQDSLAIRSWLRLADGTVLYDISLENGKMSENRNK